MQPWLFLGAAFVLVGAVFARPLLVRRVWPFGRQEGMLLALAASGIAGEHHRAAYDGRAVAA